MTRGRIYLDHAATTPVEPDVLDVMLPILSGPAGNPSSPYREGRHAKDALEEARTRSAQVLGAEPGEIVFTGSGSEGASLAIRGAAFAARRQGRAHLITSAIEHSCVLRTIRQLERHHGFEATYLPVDAAGRFEAASVVAALRADTALVSVQYANNEVGVIQPIAAVGRALRDHPALFHTDAVQAPGSLTLDTQALGVDLFSIAGHKFYAPKGVGVLYVRSGVRLVPQVMGGTQERGRRAGTENVAYAVGLAHALARAEARRTAYVTHTRALSEILINGILALPGARLNGPSQGRLPNNTNVCLEGVDGEALLLALDREGIAASSGSACTSASLEPSHVLLAMGIPAHIARSSLRLTTGWSNTEDQMRRVIAVLDEIVAKLRQPAAIATGAGIG